MKTPIERGAKFNGKIKNLADFGIFIELFPGTTGLLHISNIPREKQRPLSDYYSVGEEVEVVVLNYEKDRGRIGLGFVREDQ